MKSATDGPNKTPWEIGTQAEAEGESPLRFPVPQDPADLRTRGGAWTIPLLCIGLAILAAGALIPAAEENHRLVYDRERLRHDLKQLDQQAGVNAEFNKSIHTDPVIMERLAQRQLGLLRGGGQPGDLPTPGLASSPFAILKAPTTEFPEYQPPAGPLFAIFRTPRNQLLLIAAGLLTVGAALIMGDPRRPKPAASAANPAV